MATLKQMMDYAKNNPNDPRNAKLKEFIVSGAYDEKAKAEGIDLTGKSKTFVAEPIEPIGPVEQTDFQKDISETGEALKGRLDTLKSDVKETQAKTFGIGQEKTQSEASGILQTAGDVAKAGLGAVGDLVIGAGKAILPQETEDKVKDTVSNLVNRFIETNFGGEGQAESPEALWEGSRLKSEFWEKLTDEQKENVKATTNIVEAGLSTTGAGVVKEVAEEGLEQGIRQGAKALGKIDEGIKNLQSNKLFNQSTQKLTPEARISTPEAPVKSLDELATRADSSFKETLSKAESEAPKITIVEKLAGIRPDIKKQISGKEDYLAQYFDVSKARNLDVNNPTPLEVAGQQVSDARDLLASQLNDVGSDIGKFRQKAKNLRANNEQVVNIEKSFNDELSKLNLTVNNGVIEKVAGKVSKTKAKGDIKALQELFDEFKNVKQNPTLENLIDFRSLVDGKINFNKLSKDASNSIDPLSRNVRKRIADEGASIVGKEQAGKLTEYSNLIDDLNEISSYVDRKAGGEFLLKRVLSERGGAPRDLIRRVKERTGIDLMDDAVMARIATDVIGNDAQKGLFRQEITNAGLDIAAAGKDLLRGDAVGAVGRFFEKGLDSIIDQEKIFLEAARN